MVKSAMLIMDGLQTTTFSRSLPWRKEQTTSLPFRHVVHEAVTQYQQQALVLV